jgi:hypothetical protein
MQLVHVRQISSGQKKPNGWMWESKFYSLIHETRPWEVQASLISLFF